MGKQQDEEEEVKRIWPGERIMQERVEELMGRKEGKPKRRWPYLLGHLASFEVLGRLGRHCKRIMICGSVRRKCSEIGDLDFVVVAGNYLRLMEECRKITNSELRKGGGVFEAGAKLIRFGYRVEGGVLPVKVNLVRPEEWWLRVVYYTGSRANNEKLEMFARRQGLVLKWDEGLMERENGRLWKKVESEEELWKSLRLEYQEPKER